MSYVLHWLVEASIGAAVMITALLVLRMLLRERVRPAFFYAAWLLVAVRLLVPFSMPSPASVLNAIPEEVPVIASYMPARSAEAGSPVISGDGLGLADTVSALDAVQASFTAEQIAFIVWGAGAAAMLLYVLLVNALFAWRLRSKRLERNHIASITYRQLCRATGMRPLRLYQANLPSPCLFGIIFPRIVLTGVCMTDEKTLNHVLLHESCHAKQGDGIWGVVRVACCVLFWFHPLVWVAASASREDAELCCDARVLGYLHDGEALDYADTLLTLVRARKRPPSIALSTSMAGKRGMKRRLQMIIRQKRTYGVITVACLLLILSVGVIACTGRELEETPVDGIQASTDGFIETASPTATATPEPTVRPLTAREEMAAVAAFAESAMPWVTYADMPQDLLAPFAAQFEQDFELYGRIVVTDTDEPFFYILMKSKGDIILPESAGGGVYGGGWATVTDADGNEILRVEGANSISIHGVYGAIYGGPSYDAGRTMPPLQMAITDGERLSRNLALGIYPVAPPEGASLAIYEGEYAGYFQLDEALTREIEIAFKQAKATTKFNLEHPGEDEFYTLSVYLMYQPLNPMLLLCSDGSVVYEGKLLNGDDMRNPINRAFDQLRDATGIDPRGFDFSLFSDLTRAELTIPGFYYEDDNVYTQVIDDPDTLNLLAKQFRDGNRNNDGGCPYTGELTLTRATGETIKVLIATDSCTSARIRHGGSYISVDYRDQNKRNSPRAVMEGIFDEIPWP